MANLISISFIWLKSVANAQFSETWPSSCAYNTVLVYFGVHFSVKTLITGNKCQISPNYADLARKALKG